jgi:hypothetical protein
MVPTCLVEVINRLEPEHESPVDVLETAVQKDNDEVKLPSDAVKELNTRIAMSTLSPFDRFRSPRGVLSVQYVCGHTNIRSLISSVWTGASCNSFTPSKAARKEQQMVSPYFIR